MSQPSNYQSKSFTISYFERLTQGGSWINNIDVSIQNWKHTISAFGGYDTATFDLADSQVIIDDWVVNGLGRPIVAYDDSLTKMWEGFVDSITVNQAGLSVVYGPLTDIANQVYGIYSTVDTTKTPPEIGVRKKTSTYSSIASQIIWGVWPDIISMAGLTDSNAEQLMAMYLKEHQDPERSSNFSFSKGNMSITVSCVGWYRTLIQPYNYTANSGTINLSTRIQELVTSQLNTWISTDYSQIVTNTTQIKRYQNDDQKAIEQIKGLTAMGDASDNRHIFGIYDDRKAVYQPSSVQMDYEIKLNNSEQLIFDINSAIIPPWRVRPGKWVFFSDFMPGLGAPYPVLHEDPRFLQIETVQFDIRIPYSVDLSGGHTSKYEQKSARLGLRGMDV